MFILLTFKFDVSFVGCRLSSPNINKVLNNVRNKFIYILPGLLLLLVTMDTMFTSVSIIDQSKTSSGKLCTSGSMDTTFWFSVHLFEMCEHIFYVNIIKTCFNLIFDLIF